MNECSRKGFDPEMVRDVARCSPWSTGSVLLQCENVDELEAMYDLFVKGDETKWMNLRATQFFRM